MTNEEKQLLLKVLCAIFPYGLICNGICRDLSVANDEYVDKEVRGPLTIIGLNYVTLGIMQECEIETVKPYLHPMSDMTEEERKELAVNYGIDYIDAKIVDFGEFLCEGSPVNIENIYGLLDWLNAHHFDYHGLIEKGLALEAKDGMYNKI